MKQFFQDLFGQFHQLLAQQTLTRRIVAGVVLVAVLLALSLPFIHFGRDAEYEVLFDQVPAGKAEALRQELANRNVDVRVREAPDGRGWTIRVPAGQAPELRLETYHLIDRTGDGVGFEIFDKTVLGESEFRQNVNLHRAIEGELQRTITAMQPVMYAKVHLAIPERSVFEREDEQPTASVLLELHEDKEVTREQVRTIQQLVAGSVERLKAQNVAVADTRGNDLTREEPEVTMTEEDRMSDRLANRKRLVEQTVSERQQYEQYLEDRIVDTFANAFGGEEHVRANVNVQFDFSQKEETEVVYDKTPVPLAEARIVHGTGEEGFGRIAEGVIGSTINVQNVDSGTAGPEEADGFDYTGEFVRNYKVGQTERMTLHPPYEIERISATVFVDYPSRPKVDENGAPVVDENGATILERQPLSDPEMRELEEAVQACINYSDERPGGLEDLVKVVNMPFSPLKLEAPASDLEQERRQEFIRLAIKWGVLGLVALFVLFMVVRPLVRIVAPRPSRPALGGPEAQPALGGAGVDHVLLEGPGESRVSEEGEAGALPDVEDEATLKEIALDEEILELVQANPRKASMVVRAWMEMSGKGA